MASTPTLYRFPKLFQRIRNQHSKVAQHFIRLRESKQYRMEQNSVLIQGIKATRDMRDRKVPLTSLIVTAEQHPYSEEVIEFPASQVLRNPDAFHARYNYLADVDLTRRILGTGAKPDRHGIFAEIPIPHHKLPTKDQLDRLLVLHHVNAPDYLGHTVSAGEALGWNAGVLTTTNCDLYNDYTIRASRGATLRWKYERVPIEHLVDFLKTYDMTPLVADVIPHKVDDLWSPLTGHYDDVKNKPMIDSGIWLWNFRNKQVKLPKRPALILSSSHGGIKGLDDEIRISIPMADGVESLDVVSSGSLIMNELNKLIK